MLASGDDDSRSFNEFPDCSILIASPLITDLIARSTDIIQPNGSTAFENRSLQLVIAQYLTLRCSVG
jgi:hypothetical protein